VAEGHGAFKAVFIPYTHYTAPLPNIDKVGRLMTALRAAVGGQVEIMVGFHGRPASAAAALAYIEALRPARPMFVEEPVPPGETASLRVVAQHARVPIATGERLIDRVEFHDLLNARAVDIIQPDICHCGGLLEAKKIAAMAEAEAFALGDYWPNTCSGHRVTIRPEACLGYGPGFVERDRVAGITGKEHLRHLDKGPIANAVWPIEHPYEIEPVRWPFWWNAIFAAEDQSGDGGNGFVLPRNENNPTDGDSRLRQLRLVAFHENCVDWQR
jgi:hypothetical protein